MYDATRQYFALWDTLVGKKQLFTYFTYAAGDGSWGAWAPCGQADPGAQKWDALLSSPEPEATPTWTVSWTPQTAHSFGRTSERRNVWMQGDFNTTDGRRDDLATLNANITGRSVRHRDLKSNALTMETCAAGWKACGHERISTPARIG